jgi:hypothetical protein
MPQHEPPVVYLDWDAVPDGVGLVVIRWVPGAVYLHQYGGTTCFQGEVEGYAVPVDLSPVRRALDDFLSARCAAQVWALRGSTRNRPSASCVPWWRGSSSQRLPATGPPLCAWTMST